MLQVFSETPKINVFMYFGYFVYSDNVFCIILHGSLSHYPYIVV